MTLMSYNNVNNVNNVNNIDINNIINDIQYFSIQNINKIKTIDTIIDTTTNETNNETINNIDKKSNIFINRNIDKLINDFKYLKLNKLYNNYNNFTLKNNRPTFYICQNYECRAAGILFYKIVKNIPYFLLINEYEKWGDIGGKTDLCDNNILDTACRETTEETNAVFGNNLRRVHDIDTYNECYEYAYWRTKNLVKTNLTHKIYIPSSKYLIYCVKLDPSLCPYAKEFDVKELQNDNVRYFEWVSCNKFKKLIYNQKTNFRINKKIILNFLHTYMT